MKKLNKKGFTLVELLAVIVILALLMVVATRTIGGTMSNAKKNALKTEAQKMLNAGYTDALSEMILNNKLSNITSNDTMKVIKKTELPEKIILEYKDGDYTGYVEYDKANTKSAELVRFCIKTNGMQIYKDFTDITISNSDVSNTPEIGEVEITNKQCFINDSSGYLHIVNE